MTGEKRLVSIWLILALATLAAWLIGHGPREIAAVPRYAQVTAIVLIACFKVRLVMREFMEVRFAPLLFRCSLDGWLAAVLCAVLGFYYASTGLIDPRVFNLSG